MKMFVAILAVGLLGAGTHSGPAVREPWPRAVIEGYIEDSGAFQLFGAGEKQLYLTDRTGTTEDKPLCFAGNGYAEAMRQRGMAVRIKAIVVNRGCDQWFLVDAIQGRE